MLSMELLFKRRRQWLFGVSLFIMITLLITGVQSHIEIGIIAAVLIVCILMLMLGFIIGSYYVLEHIAKRYRYEEKYDCKTLLKELYNIEEKKKE